MSLSVSFSKSRTEKSDNQLWSAFKADDKDAFNHIYYNNIKALLDYALKITSDKLIIEDCVQEMFLDLWNKRAQLSEVHNIKNYLFTTLRRRIVKAITEKDRDTFDHPLEDTFELPVDVPIITSEEEYKKKKSIHEVLKKLSPEQREIIYLKYFSNFTFDEIAAVLNTSKKSVYNSLSKSMIKFRKAFNAFTFFLFL